jgi:hypothetical protein
LDASCSAEISGGFGCSGRISINVLPWVFFYEAHGAYFYSLPQRPNSPLLRECYKLPFYLAFLAPTFAKQLKPRFLRPLFLLATAKARYPYGSRGAVVIFTGQKYLYSKILL